MRSMLLFNEMTKRFDSLNAHYKLHVLGRVDGNL